MRDAHGDNDDHADGASPPDVADSGVAPTIASSAPGVADSGVAPTIASSAPGVADSGVAPTIASSSGARIAPGAVAATIVDTGAPPADAARRSPVPTIRPPSRVAIANRYAIGSEIARGGMGRVVEATDTVLERTVALKEALGTDDDLRRRFAREVKITARLEHPSIVPVHDAGTMPDGSPYYVMRKVSGRPLADLVLAADTLAERLTLLPHLLAAAHAIAHAHARGVVHRDIKPSNILVGELGETIVIDWGLAKVIGEPDEASAVSQVRPLTLGDDPVHTHVGSMVGTPGFMPPEQLAGKAVDVRSDVYALGATLYFLLARRVPHAADTGQKMIDAALAGPPPPVSDLVGGIPPELVTIVDKALTYDPERRYHDAGGLAEDVDRFLKGQLVASHHYSRRERLRRLWRKHRIAITIAAIAVVALAAGSWVSVSRIIRERNRADSALTQALQRNELLELSRARALVPTHPTAAIAIVKPLAATYWREARSIALAARATGIARGYPGSRWTSSITLTRDGTRALTTGIDGVVRILDLVSHTTRTLGTAPGSARGTYADDERTVVVWTKTSLVTFDVATAARTVYTLPVAVRLLRAHHNTLWWCGTDGSVWTHAIGEAPRRIAVDDEVEALAISPDGSVALAGKLALWLVHDGQAKRTLDGPASSLVWDGERLGGIAGGRVVEVASDGRVLANDAAEGAQSVAWQDHQLYVGAERRLTLHGVTVAEFDGDVRDLHPGPKGSLIVHTGLNELLVVDKAAIVRLPPTSSIGFVAASPHSNVLLGGSQNVVLTWQLPPLLPRTIPLSRGAVEEARYGYDHAVVAYPDAASWIDLRSGDASPLPIGNVRDAAFAPDGRHVVVVDKDRRGVVFAHGSTTGRALDVPVEFVKFAGPDQLVLATPSGELYEHAIGSGTTTALGVLGSRSRDLEVNADWISALSERTLWRRERATGATTTLDVTPAYATALLASGDIALADRDDPRLHIWQRDGRVVDHVLLPPPLTTLFHAGPDHLVVFTGGESGHLVELGGDHEVTAIYPPGSRMLEIEHRSDLAVHRDSVGRVHVTDNRTGYKWQHGTPRKEPFRWPWMSVDQQRVLAVADDAIVEWDQPFPTTPEATQRLLDELTNARLVTGAPGLGGTEVQFAW